MRNPKCSTCQDNQFVIEPRLGGPAVAKLCTCSQECSVCKGAGHVLSTRESTFSEKVGTKQYEVLTTCSCTALRRKLQLFNSAELPGALGRATLESYRTYVPAQGKALDVVRDFVSLYDPKKYNQGFALSGPVGTGKTHLLVGALSQLALQRGVRTRYVEISFLFHTIRRGFNEGKSGGEIIEPLAEVPVLAIDELGKGRGSQFELDTLDELISRRYNGQLTTLIATNSSLRPPEEASSTPPLDVRGYHNTANTSKGVAERAKPSHLVPGGGPPLYEIVGARIYSRLCEMCMFVEMPPNSPDSRRGRKDGRLS